jgi:DNA-binding PadR family transcriptional regulator
LEDAGLVQSEPTTVGEKLEKHVYSITEEGLQVLTDWAAEEPVYRPNRDPERLQLIFSDLGSIESVRRHLEIHRGRFAERRDQLVRTRERIMGHRHERVQRRIEGRTPTRQELTLLLRDLAYTGDIRRAELEVEWAEMALGRLAEIEQAEVAPA